MGNASRVPGEMRRTRVALRRASISSFVRGTGTLFSFSKLAVSIPDDRESLHPTPCAKQLPLSARVLIYQY